MNVIREPLVFLADPEFSKGSCVHFDVSTQGNTSCPWLPGEFCPPMNAHAATAMEASGFQGSLTLLIKTSLSGFGFQRAQSRQRMFSNGSTNMAVLNRIIDLGRVRQVHLHVGTQECD